MSIKKVFKQIADCKTKKGDPAISLKGFSSLLQQLKWEEFASDESYLVLKKIGKSKRGILIIENADNTSAPTLNEIQSTLNKLLDKKKKNK